MKKWLPFLLLMTLLLLGFSLWPKEKKGTIILDAGHGGTDPGSISYTGTYEKDIALRITLALKEAFEAENYEVILTRSTDTTVSLDQRIVLANATDALLFLSIHGNSLLDNPFVQGVQVLYYPDKMGRNEQFAQSTVASLAEQLTTPNKGAIARNELAVLRGTQMPSLLIEAGFLSHPEEAILLEQPAYHTQLSQAIVQATIPLLNELQTE